MSLPLTMISRIVFLEKCPKRYMSLLLTVIPRIVLL